VLWGEIKANDERNTVRMAEDVVGRWAERLKY
jgi:hypothetical protein